MTDVANNVVDRLVVMGTRFPNRQKAVEEVHRLIKDDYIPGGGTVSKITNLRAAPAGHRCGVRTGEDIQSGPFYCGKPASLIANSADGKSGVVAACEGHEHALRALGETR